MAPEASCVVIDNASEDRTVERLRSVASDFRGAIEIIENPRNMGFAAAVNQGVCKSRDEYALLLNPDVRLRTGIAKLVEASHRYGLSAGKLVDDSGQAQQGFTIRRLPTPATLAFETLGLNRLCPSNGVNRKYRYLDRDLEKPGPVEQPAGAFLMFRKDVWEKLGGFDESFLPIWFEDVDFCKRAVDAGFRIEYRPDVFATHEGGNSIAQLSSGCRALRWYDSLLRYVAKYFSPWEYRAICLTIILGAFPRSVAGVFEERSFAPVSTLFDVLALAVRRCVSPPRNVSPNKAKRENDR
jgi:GT2 family glycosyltransferase